MWPRVMNPAVFADPQVIPQLVPPRGRGRPTLYSPGLIDEFIGFIVDGLTLAQAAKIAGMPGRRTLQDWLERYPEFRHKYDAAVEFRNRCWMDDCVDIADDTASDVKISITENGILVARMSPELTAQRKLKCDLRWKQINGALISTRAAVARAGEDAKIVGEEKVVKHDPIFGKLYEWELDVQRRRGKEFTQSGSNANGANGHGRRE